MASEKSKSKTKFKLGYGKFKRSIKVYKKSLENTARFIENLEANLRDDIERLEQHKKEYDRELALLKAAEDAGITEYDRLTAYIDNED